MGCNCLQQLLYILYDSDVLSVDHMTAHVDM